MFSMFLLSYRNTHESLGELEKTVETLACGSYVICSYVICYYYCVIETQFQPMSAHIFLKNCFPIKVILLEA